MSTTCRLANKPSSWDQPWQCLLSAHTSIGGRSEADAPLRPLQHHFAGSPMLQKLLKRESHETGRLHVRTCAWASRRCTANRTSRSPATGTRSYPHQLGKLAVKTRSGYGSDLYPDGQRLLLPDRHHRLVQAQRFWLGNLSITTCPSASKPSRTRWRDTAGPRSPARTRAASSPAMTSPRFPLDQEIDISMDRKGMARKCRRRACVAIGTPTVEEACLKAYNSVAEARIHRQISQLLQSGTASFRP